MLSHPSGNMPVLIERDMGCKVNGNASKEDELRE